VLRGDAQFKVVMPGVRKLGQKNLNTWIDEKLLKRWEKRCCVDIHGKIIKGSMSQRVRYLIKQDLKKHNRGIPPKDDWYE